MSNKEVKITITAIDNFSKAFNQLDDAVAQAGKAAEGFAGNFKDFADIAGGSALGKIAKELATIGVGMQTVGGRAALALKGIKSLTEGYIKLYDASKKNFAEGLEKVGSVCSTILEGLGKVGTGFMTVLQGVTGADLSLAGLVKSSVQFEENLQRVVNMNGQLRGDTEKSEKVYHSLTEAAQKWALDSQYSTDQISAGMVQMTQSGLDYKEVLNSLGATIALSTAGNLDFARSAEILTNTMNAFKETTFDEKTTMRYADVLAGVANSSATSVDQIGNALVNFGASAGLMGYKLEEVGIGIGLMGNQFIKSGRAGTAMKNIINRVTSENSSAKKAIEEYNLEAFEQEMQNGNLVQAFKELIKGTEQYDKATKNKIATDIAGSYGAQGLLTIMTSTVEELERMEVAIKQNGDAWGIHTGMMETTYGKFLQLSSIIQVFGTELTSMFGPAINRALDGLINFGKSLFEISGEGENCIVKLKSLAQVAEMSKGWGDSLANGIRNAINGLKEFTSGPQMQQIMTIGTNIIQGICRGISENKANLQEAFSNIIQRACEFIKTNAPAIGQAGRDILEALANAIKENEGLIKEALDAIMQVITDWAKGGAALTAAVGLFADSLINGLVKQAVAKATGRGAEIWNALFSGVSLEDGSSIKNGEGTGGLGGFLTENTMQGRGFKEFDDFVGGMSKRAGEKLKEGVHWIADGVKSWFLGESHAAEAAKEGGTKMGTTTGENFKVSFDEQGQPIVDSATKTGTDAAAGIEAALRGMDLQYLQSLGQEMTNVGNITSEMANSMSTSFTNIADSARTQFTNLANIAKTQMTSLSNSVRTELLNATNIVKNQATNMTNALRTGFLDMTNIVKNQTTNMANALRTEFTNMTNIAKNQFNNIANEIKNQMTNATNTIRTQATNMSNIVKNQATNMSNSVRTEFTNMSNIAKNQFTNIANNIRTQMTNCSNIIKNQATNMNDAFRTAFVNMANIANNQMPKIADTVRTQMLNCTNIVKNQGTNMSSAMTQAMSGMATAATTAMNKVVAAVRTGMAQAKAIASSPISINITSNIQRKVTTTHVAGGLKQTMTSIGTNSLSVANPTIMSGRPKQTIVPVSGEKGNYTFTIPVVVDGKEIARATARYSQAELDKLAKRNSRKRGE